MVSFFVVEGMPVFMTAERQRQLESLALEDLPPSAAIERASDTKVGRRIARQVEEMIHRFLMSEARSGKARFRREWVEFDFRDDEARQNVSRMLWDYCLYYGHSRLLGFKDAIREETNPFAAAVMRSLMVGAEDFLPRDEAGWPYPKDHLLLLLHEVRPYLWFWRFWPWNMKDRRVALHIMVTEVSQLVGTLADFWLVVRSALVHCAADLTIIPHPEAGETDLDGLLLERQYRALGTRHSD